MEIIGYGILGILAGLFSGLLGIGGAIVVIPALIFIFGFDQKTAQGTTLFLMLPPIGIMAFLEYYKAGNVNIKAGIIIAIFFILGGWLGGIFVGRIDNNILRKIFALFLIAVSVNMLIK